MTEIVYATIDTTDPTAPVNIDFLNLGCTKCIYFSSYFRVHPYVDCKCDSEGSIGKNCDDYGKCTCANENVIGDKCNSCADGYYGFPQCTQGIQLCKIFCIEN